MFNGQHFIMGYRLVKAKKFIFFGFLKYSFKTADL